MLLHGCSGSIVRFTRHSLTAHQRAMSISTSATEERQEAAYRSDHARHCFTGDQVHTADLELIALPVAVLHLAPGR